MRDRPLKTLVVDDEPLAREVLRDVVARDGDLELVGESATAAQALAAIRAESPDLVLLDVEMPDRSGLDVVAELGPRRCPAIVFVTAFDEHAVRAFELNAVDYVLKPFDDERLRAAIARVKRRLRVERTARLGERVHAMVQSLDTSAGRDAPTVRLTIRDGGRVVFLDAAEVEWVQAADYYAQVHTRGESYLHREPLASLERRLAPAGFVRVHRSALVNRGYVVEVKRRGRRWIAVLSSGAEVPIARRHRGAVNRLG